ncbi:MAG: hypothetical protein Ta2B_16100 [Termitinemataceae bacterium]|nr:MAG: hypothetical protein Ta2B_16100 [Termitinemataceae bacterium]
MKIFVKLFYFFPLSLLSVVSANAANVTVMVIETGLSVDQKVSLAEIWESGIMAVLFDAGHIVTNAQSIKIVRNIDEDIPEEVETNIKGAFDGGSDYFLMALLNYNESNDDKNTKPVQITLKLIILPNKILYQENMPKPVAATQRDEFINAQKAARIIMPYIGGKA